MSQLSKRRILIIDDQLDIHDDYRKIITPKQTQSSGLDEVEAELFGGVVTETKDWDWYEIDSAYQGHDALALVEQATAEGRPYAVAFVDIRMPPGWDGIQTVRKIWEKDPEILIVLCSAHSDYSWDDIVRELGRTDRFLILRKPFDGVEVRQCAAALSERWLVARTDALTGLLNRRSFEEHLQREWAYQVRNDRPLSCVMIDIDYFKTVNDRFGHSAGDRTLILLANLIQSHLRPGDVVCRYGGEELCVLMPNASETEGCAWAETLREAINEHSFAVADQTLRVTASFGVSTRTAAMFGADELVGLADEALRAAKQAGRNRVIGCTELSQVRDGVRRLQQYAMLFEHLTAQDIMTGSVVCLDKQLKVGEAVGTMLQCQITSAPVVNSDGVMVGIVSEKDIMESLGCGEGWDATLGRIMTSRVIHYDRNTPAHVIFEFLCRVQIRRVIIVEEGRPVGIVSRGSFLRWVQNYIGEYEGPEVDSRPHLMETANALTQRAMLLKHELESDPTEVLAPVVTGVTSMQSLMCELLSWARRSSNSRGSERFAGINE